MADDPQREPSQASPDLDAAASPSPAPSVDELRARIDRLQEERDRYRQDYSASTRGFQQYQQQAQQREFEYQRALQQLQSQSRQDPRADDLTDEEADALSMGGAEAKAVLRRYRERVESGAASKAVSAVDERLRQTVQQAAQAEQALAPAHAAVSYCNAIVPELTRGDEFAKDVERRYLDIMAERQSGALPWMPGHTVQMGQAQVNPFALELAHRQAKKGPSARPVVDGRTEPAPRGAPRPGAALPKETLDLAREFGRPPDAIKRMQERFKRGAA